MTSISPIPHFPLQMPQEVCSHSGKQLLFQLQMTEHYLHSPATHLLHMLTLRIQVLFIQLRASKFYLTTAAGPMHRYK